MEKLTNDFQTKDIICYVLNIMGKKNLSKYVENGSLDLDSCIRYVKYKAKQYSEMQEMINYFL